MRWRWMDWSRWLPFSAAALAGCLGLGEGTPPTRYYVLQAAAVAPSAESIEAAIDIAVAVVDIPRFLDRPQIVTHGAGSEVLLADFDRWAEPLAAGIERVTVENLSRLLPRARVATSLERAAPGGGLFLGIQVLNFDGSLGGKAALAAR